MGIGPHLAVDADPVDLLALHHVASENERAPIAEGLTVARNEAAQLLVEGGTAVGRVGRITLRDAGEARDFVDSAPPLVPELLRGVQVVAASRFQIDQRSAPAATNDEVQDGAVTECRRRALKHRSVGSSAERPGERRG